MSFKRLSITRFDHPSLPDHDEMELSRAVNSHRVDELDVARTAGPGYEGKSTGKRPLLRDHPLEELSQLVTDVPRMQYRDM